MPKPIIITIDANRDVTVTPTYARVQKLADGHELQWRVRSKSKAKVHVYLDNPPFDQPPGFDIVHDPMRADETPGPEVTITQPPPVEYHSWIDIDIDVNGKTVRLVEDHRCPTIYIE